jgi:hypothetical protein
MCNEDKIWAAWKGLDGEPPKPPVPVTKTEEVKPKPKPDFDLILGM